MTDEGEIGILVRGLSIVVVAGEPAALPRRNAVSGYAAGDWIPVGSVDGRPYCAAPLADGDGLRAGLALTPVRALFDASPSPCSTWSDVRWRWWNSSSCIGTAAAVAC
jgi:hypothetical protein